MKTSPDTFTRKFATLQKEVRGVEKAFIFPKAKTLESEDNFQRNLGNLLFILSEKIPKKILIHTVKKKIAVCVTENFLLGVILCEEANAPLVEMNLTRMALALEESFAKVMANIEALEERIQNRIDMLTSQSPIRTSDVTLVSRELGVEGEIKLAVKPHTEEESLKKKIHAILNEEIPFFCTRSVTIEIKTKFTGLLTIQGLKRQQLVKVINKIQGI
jgi:hypothetical protein